jgi:hypothetical protein
MAPERRIFLFKIALAAGFLLGICSYDTSRTGAWLAVREKVTWVNRWDRPLLKYNCRDVEERS